MPSINFIAAYNVCNILGAKIYLTDVDSFNGQMTPENLLNCIKINKLKNIKVVITSQLGGQPLNNAEFEYFFRFGSKCEGFSVDKIRFSYGIL